MKAIHAVGLKLPAPILRKGLVFFLLLLLYFPSLSQCPQNIDFEAGNFNGWVCFTGNVVDDAGENVITLYPQPGPVTGQHTMLSSFPGDGLDEYGGFPKNCPNGSGHSIKLGNDLAGGQAEGLLYQFVIPPNSNKFTLTYHYAVVFEDPGHEPQKQPRLEIEVKNITDEETLDCFSFSYIADGSLPGFHESVYQPHRTPVLYKDWTTNTIYLNGYQGKTMGLYMRTSDCTYAIHFGYAYLDVSSACDNSFVGETYCAQDTAVEINAPYGYQSYKWFNNTYTQLLGTEQRLRIQPPPPAGTTLAVELTPFPGYGCKDTLSVELQDTLTATANAGADVASCNFRPVQLGVPPMGEMIYSWSPAYGLSDPNISNPRALPATDTTYILNIRSRGGGCVSSDTVRVFVRNIDNSLQLTGDSINCYGEGPDPVLKVMPVNNIQWYKNDLPVTGANQLTYTVTSSGSYYASLLSDICVDPLKTRSIYIMIDTPATGINYPLVDVAFNFPIKLQARNFSNSVLWTPDISLDDNTSYTPYFRSMNPRLYNVLIRDIYGCLTVDTQLVKTHKEIAIYVPSVFTPDGDGVNDFLKPLLLGFDKLKYFRIYDRWGKLLFETKSDIPGWDGGVNKIPQEPQTVVWILEAVDIDGKTHFKKGTTLLMPR